MGKENDPSNKENPSNPPTSSPQRSPSPGPAAAGEEILKTPEDVLADLSGTPPPPAAAAGVGQSGAVAIGVGGGSMVVGEGVPCGVGAGKKRKGSEVKNPPSGTPTCPVCNKTFSSWKGAFGHMRKHPDRHYRGFFKPPAFSSSSSSNTHAAPATTHGEGGSSAQGKTGRSAAVAALVGGLLLDLNLPTEEAPRSDAAGEGNEAPPAEEGKKVGFDLNELPPPDHDDDDDED